jgi:hypothetical protein
MLSNYNYFIYIYMHHNTKKQGKRTRGKPSSKWDNIQTHVKKVRYEI